jgi:hypothetical protein
VERSGRRGSLHGYIHCMPYGNDEFVIKLLPLHPGYVMIVCADVSAAPATATNVDVSMARKFVCVTEKLWWAARKGRNNPIPSDHSPIFPPLE